MKYHFILIYLSIIFFGCAEQANKHTSSEKSVTLIPAGKFMSIVATDTPTLLLPGFINTPMGEYNGTFNPEGTEFFYTVSNIYYDVIVYTQLMDNNHWSQPTIAPFSVKEHEFDPLFSPDGNYLYFSSHRPIFEGSPTDASNIWRVKKEDDGWREPEHIPLYGPARGNYFSSLTSSGDIYFNIWNIGDMYKGSKVDTGFVIKSMGEIVNSNRGDGDPFIAPDESYLIFRSNRSDGLGSGDLWISFNIDDEWKSPINLGERINSRYNEMCPYVTTDGKLFIFSSGRFDKSYYDESINDLQDVAVKLNSWDNGQQNIYTMSAAFIQKMKKQRMEPSTTN